MCVSVSFKNIVGLIKRLLPTEFKYDIKYMIFRLGFGRTGKLLKENRELFADCSEAMYQMAAAGRNMVDYIDSYKSKTVKTIKLLNIPLNKNEPILLCAVKDDLVRVRAQVEYHRKIGIRHFAYIDNMSTDGTFEWLENQEDVSLFRVNEKFNSDRRNSWRRQVADVLGYEKWYLVVDSDEFFTYPGIESSAIDKYMFFLEKKKINSVFSIMLDMYSKNSLFKSSSTIENDFMKEYCYFDADTYKVQKARNMWLVNGGPRARIFPSNTLLTKYPLIKLSKSMIIGTHSNYFVNPNFDTSLPIAFLLHYKFLSHDNSIFEERIKSGVYFGGSAEYKTYKEVYSKKPELSFYYEDSQKLNDSMDLMKINIVNKKFFDGFFAE